MYGFREPLRKLQHPALECTIKQSLRHVLGGDGKCRANKTKERVETSATRFPDVADQRLERSCRASTGIKYPSEPPYRNIEEQTANHCAPNAIAILRI